MKSVYEINKYLAEIGVEKEEIDYTLETKYRFVDDNLDEEEIRYVERLRGDSEVLAEEIRIITNLALSEDQDKYLGEELDRVQGKLDNLLGRLIRSSVAEIVDEDALVEQDWQEQELYLLDRVYRTLLWIEDAGVTID